MEDSNEINFLNLLIGLLLVIGTIIYLIYTIRGIQKDKEYDSWIFSYDINIIVGTLIFLVIGIILVYRELSKLQLSIILIFLLPCFGFTQSEACLPLKSGTFEIYENDEKVGLVYRKGAFQLEDYLDGRELTVTKIRERDCTFYIRVAEAKEALDTVTMFVTYDKIKKGYYSFLAKPAYLKMDYEYRGEIRKIDKGIKPEVLKVFERLEND